MSRKKFQIAFDLEEAGTVIRMHGEAWGTDARDALKAWKWQNPKLDASASIVSVDLPTNSAPPKSQGVAVILCLLLGTLGIHRFYLGRPVSGVIYLIATLFFFWTFIPLLVALVEFILLLVMSREAFTARYSN